MATVVSSTEIMVTWDIVHEIDQNGVITMYEVLYVPLETFGGAIGPLSVNVIEQRATLTDLQEYVNYTISVRAYTELLYCNSEPVTRETFQDSKKSHQSHNMIFALKVVGWEDQESRHKVHTWLYCTVIIALE